MKENTSYVSNQSDIRGIFMALQQKKVAPQHIGLVCEIKFRNNKYHNISRKRISN